MQTITTIELLKDALFYIDKIEKSHARSMAHIKVEEAINSLEKAHKFVKNGKHITEITL